MFKKSKHARGAVALVALALLGLTAAPAPALAAGAEVQIGTCTFVDNPTPTVHTECPGADLRLSVGMEGGLDLRWANLEGANISGSPLLIAATSVDHIRLAGADLTGTTVGYFVDFSGGSLKGAILDGATIFDSDLSGLDLSDTHFTNTNLHDSDLSGANLNGATFAGADTGGLSIAGATVVGAALPANLDGGSAAGVDLGSAASIAAGSTFKGTDLTGAVFDGLLIDGLNMDGSELLESSFDDVVFTAGSAFSARGANFTDGSFAGVDFSTLGDLQLQGAKFAFVDFTGSTVELFGGGYYADATFDGAHLYGSGEGAIFHRASMVGVDVDSALTSPMLFNGAQFHDADLTDANLDLTVLTGAQFVRSDLVRARIQSQQVYGMSGVVFYQADLTDAVLPPAMNLYGWDSQKWLYGIFVEDSTIDGSSFVNGDVETTAPIAAPSTVTYPLPDAFVNADGQLPYDPTYDGNYWWGGRYGCDHTSGEVFPLGVTVVSCELRFEHVASGSTAAWSPPGPLDWATSTPADPDPWYTYPSGNKISGLAPALAAPIAHGATLGTLSGDVDEYKYREQFFPTEAGVYTSSTSSFTVTVNAAPELSGDLANGLVGEPYSSAVGWAGFPAPAFSLESGALPAGLSLSPTGELHGTPAAGAAGEYEFTVKATNSEGSATLSQTVWIVDPVVELEHDEILHAGDKVDVEGAGFTPGGDVEVWLHSAPKLVATVTADAKGEVHTQVSTTELGTHHVELIDVTTLAVAVSSPFTVSGAALPFMGTEAAATISLALGLLALGTIFILRRRKQRTNAN